MKDSLFLPAIRGLIGEWTYYICLLRMQDVAERISDVADLHSSKEFKDLLQRRLTDRSQYIADYILNQRQRFFNAIVVGTYGGNPNWFELSVNIEGSDINTLPDYFEGTLGILMLDGSENLWAIDGQHRVSGIIQAIEENPDRGSDEICAIFVAGVSSSKREDDPDGFERTRRLFTTLNKHAKKVDKRDIIALDEDDTIAIITRILVDENELLRGRVATGYSRSIPVSDKKNFTTIEIIYDVLDLILKDRGREAWRRFKGARPSDYVLTSYLEKSLSLFNILSLHIEDFGNYLADENISNAAEPYRNNSGGNLLFRPIGLLLIARVIRLLFEFENLDLNNAIRIISQAPLQLSDVPWADLLWDVGNQRMITAGPNQKVAKWLLYYMVGGDISNIRTRGGTVNLNLLQSEYESIVKHEIDLQLFRL